MVTTWFWSLVLFLLIFLFLGTKTRVLSMLKCSLSPSSTPVFPHIILSTAWDFQVTFPEGISSLKCPEFLSFFGKHWSPVLNFVYLGQELLKKCMKKTTWILCPSGKQDSTSIDVIGSTCTLLHSPEGVAAQRTQGWVTVVIIRKKLSTSGSKTVFFL